MGRGSSVKRHIGRIFAVLLVVAALAAVLAGCTFDPENNVILAKHHFKVQQTDLPEGVALFRVDSDFETDGKGNYVNNGDYVRFEIVLSSGYELGTLTVHIDNEKGADQTLELKDYISAETGRTVYRAGYYAGSDFTASLVGEPVATEE